MLSQQRSKRHNILKSFHIDKEVESFSERVSDSNISRHIRKVHKNVRIS